MSDATSRLPPTRIPPRPYRRAAAPRPGVLRLDGNEGSKPSAALVASLGRLDPAALRVYPEPAALEARIAARHGVPPARIVVTAGADEALDRAFRAFLGPGREVIVPVPSFEMLPRFAANAGGELVAVPWEGAFPVDEIVARIGPSTSLVAIVSPNNPTGLACSEEDLSRVAHAARGALVLLDHVYVEYADEDLTPTALTLDNVLVYRSFSKAWGLAGCRVGYVVAPETVAGVLRSAGCPFPVSAPSLALVSERLETGEEELRSHVAAVRRERADLRGRLDARGTPSPPSQGNFLLADFGRRAELAHGAMALAGVLVRRFASRPRLAGRLRITVPGDDGDFRTLLAALDLALAPEALLLDLDGVLADVEGSYRACVIETAASFGVAVTREDVERAKLAGDANNDWVLTRRLIEAAGREAALDDVTARFQELYLGQGATPGLRQHERPLAKRDEVAALAARVPLAIVTGRPRAEAEWFLARAELTDLVSETVCMEDAPAKPDPRPVRLALERLGVARAWLIGDTPDDLRAAAAAGVVPIGLPAPGHATEATSAALRAAGAVVVLERVADALELLP